MLAKLVVGIVPLVFVVVFLANPQLDGTGNRKDEVGEATVDGGFHRDPHDTGLRPRWQ
jgi:hypothetical protein